MEAFVSINRNGDFLRLYRRGKSVAKPGVVVYGEKRRSGVTRIGITTSKKIGNAVERNRSRRLIRAAWQGVCRSGELDGAWDLVFVARVKTRYLKSTSVQRQMTDALREIGALK